MILGQTILYGVNSSLPHYPSYPDNYKKCMKIIWLPIVMRLGQPQSHIGQRK